MSILPLSIGVMYVVVIGHGSSCGPLDIVTGFSVVPGPKHVSDRGDPALVHGVCLGSLRGSPWWLVVTGILSRPYPGWFFLFYFFSHSRSTGWVFPVPQSASVGWDAVICVKFPGVMPIALQTLLGKILFVSSSDTCTGSDVDVMDSSLGCPDILADVPPFRLGLLVSAHLLVGIVSLFSSPNRKIVSNGTAGTWDPVSVKPLMLTGSLASNIV